MTSTKKYIHHLSNAKPEKEVKKPSPQPSLKIVDAQYEKMEVERFKKLLSEKIKDPKMAKKAALIISEMLNKK